MVFQSLNGTWMMNEKGSEAYIEAKVPGSVLSALLVQHRIRDPYFGTNEYAAEELFRQDYFFSREFEVMPELLQQDRIRLCCKGIDTIAHIYLNGVPVGTTANMHRTYYCDVKQHLRSGVNLITVELLSPLNYIENYHPGYDKDITHVPQGSTLGAQFIRKPHSQFGWDMGPKLPDLGIWRSIDLIGYSLIHLDDVTIIQHHEKKNVRLEIRVHAELFRRGPYIIQAELRPPKGRITAITETMTDRDCTLFMDVDNPDLWWPNGYGEHPIYQVSVYALDMNGVQWDSKSFKIGLRTITVSQERDEFGNEFCLKVNNVKMFAMGANYIPEDAIYPFITKEKIDYLLRSAVKCNFNTIRVWGGGYYPSDDFYDMCDEYGLIVWQDMMFAGNLYEMTEDFRRNVEAEATDNIKRFRHHACIGLICGNDRIEQSIVDGALRDHSEALKQDYLHIFEEVIADVAAKCAPQIFYWPSSPSSGGGLNAPNDETVGDSHCWDVWYELHPFNAFDDHRMRFCSSFGFQSFPSIKTVRTFTREDDHNIFSQVMESHQKNGGGNGRIVSYLSENFLYPKDFESMLYVTQIQQALATKYGVEHFRRQRGCTMGALYWTLNDNWPGVSWSSIDYFGRWKALQYMAKNFFAPVAGSIKREGNEVSVYIQNETRDYEMRRVRISLQTFDFRLLHEAEYEVDVAPGSALLVCEMDYTPYIEGIENSVFMEAVFIDEEDNVLSSEIEVFVPYKRLALDLSSISYSVIELVDEYVIRMMSGGFAAFVELDLKQADAVFSENYFHLTSKREKAVRLKKSDIRYLDYTVPEIQNGYELEQQLVIRTLRDTY